MMQVGILTLINYQHVAVSDCHHENKALCRGSMDRLRASGMLDWGVRVTNGEEDLTLPIMGGKPHLTCIST